MRPISLGSHPRTALVLSLETGPLPVTQIAKPPKCASASSGVNDLAGTPTWRPIASAISLNGTPSATA